MYVNVLSRQYIRRQGESVIVFWHPWIDEYWVLGENKTAMEALRPGLVTQPDHNRDIGTCCPTDKESDAPA